MGRRLAGWRALSWRDRRRLLTCIFGLTLIHGLLACLGYARTRRLVERLTRRTATHAAGPAELADAQALARVAAIASRHGMVEATCLRRSLLLLGWLRRRGLQPVLQLGIAPQIDSAFQAHAWVELEGVRLLQLDDGHRPFQTTTP